MLAFIGGCSKRAGFFLATISCGAGLTTAPILGRAETASFEGMLVVDLGGENQGRAIAVNGQTVAVRSRGDEVYIWRKPSSGTPWVLQQTLQVPNASVSGSGAAALNTDWLMVADTQVGPSISGAVHVYRWNGVDQFEFRETLTSPTPRNQGGFGRAVIFFADLLVIGAPGESSLGATSGAPTDGGVHVFRRNVTDNWQPIALSRAPGARSNGAYGSALTQVGSDLVIQEPFAFIPIGVQNRGAVHRCSLNQADVLACSEVVRPGGAAFETFGQAASFNEDSVFISAPGGTFATGTVTVLSPGWTVTQTIHAPTEAASNSFGSSLAASPDRVFVGTPLLWNSALSLFGVVYSYKRANGEWQFDSRLGLPVLPQGSLCCSFGATLVHQDDRLYVGAPDLRVGTVNRQGAVFVFVVPMFGDSFE